MDSFLEETKNLPDAVDLFDALGKAIGALLVNSSEMPFFADFIDALKMYGGSFVEVGCVNYGASISVNMETVGIQEFFELVESRME